MIRKFCSLLLLCLSCALASAANIEGPFLILSTPYYEDGAVNYDNLVKEARFAKEWNCCGLIWPQSNDSIDLLSKEERFRGMETLVKEWKENPSSTVLTLGVSGDDTEDMLVYAREAERLADEYGVDIVLAARPPYYGNTQEKQREYFEALAAVAKRPVIIQTYVNEHVPVMSVDFLVSLAKKFPATYGWIKEESDGLAANDRQKAEIEAAPAIKTVFSAWGGWQWLYQRRQIGTCGLLTERVAYTPIVSYIWKCMKDGDASGRLTQAYAMYRLLIDQRFLEYASLRGYSLHYFERLGVFDNTISRWYAGNPDGPDETYKRKTKSKWTLIDVKLSPSQTAELDKCYDDMLKFVGQE